MKDIELHETQKEALDFISESFNSGRDILALVGAGGTGKTEISSRLPEKTNLPIVFTATTNKAASRLSKDIKDVKTIHSAVAKPSFKPLYNDIEVYINGINEIKDNSNNTDKIIKEYDSKYKFLESTKSFLNNHNFETKKLKDFNNIMDFLHYIKVESFDPEIFNGYTINERIPDTIVAIDESSMLPTKSYYNNGSLITIGIDAVRQVYDKILLIGDDAQLPPIDGKSSFEGIQKKELTKNFRSNKELLEAIQWARDGLSFYKFTSNSEQVNVVDEIDQEWYDGTFLRDDIVHLAYTNNTRRKIVKRIRGSKANRPINGEPLLWRGKSTEALSKGEIGIYNSSNNGIEFESSLQYADSRISFDEYDLDKYCRVQYGYSMTAHMAQGSEIDHVIVHLYDIPHFIDKDTKRRWIYTACSRAKKTLTIVL